MDTLAGAFPLNLIEPLTDACRRSYAVNEVPVAAACVDPVGGLSIAHNRMTQSQNPYAHAEYLALRNMQAICNTRYLQDSILVVSLEPCTFCMGLAALFRISGILYFVSDDKAGYFTHHGIMVSRHSPMHIHIGTHHMWARQVEDGASEFRKFLSSFFADRRSR